MEEKPVFLPLTVLRQAERSVNTSRPIVTFRSESSIYRRQSVAPPLIWRIVDSSHKWFMYPSGSRTSAP